MTTGNKPQGTRTVYIGDRPVGDGHPCFITYEAGPTHDGVETACRLIDLAADAGADAIKFQILDPERLVADKQQMFSFDVLVNKETGETETVSEPLYDILKRRSLSKDEWRQVKAKADSRGLAFFATIAFEDEIELLEELGIQSIKIASADVTHFPLLRRAARSGISIQLDTGNSTIGEIEQAVDVIRSEGNDDIIIHQCPSGYPARLESVNLNIIPTLKQMFGLPVAFSDHTPGCDMDVASVALGANMVEKTITEDRMIRQVEHVMSLEPSEMVGFIKTIRDVETALGSPRRIMTAEERAKSMAIRRSVYIKGEAKAGQRLGDLDVEFRRPGHGIAPDVYEKLVDMALVRDLSDGHQLALSDLAAQD